jgi:hypothetical protein
MSADRYAWMDSALCAQADPDLWTGTETGGSQKAPKKVCQRCPVRPDCNAHRAALEAATDTVLPGIWGGTSRRQRQAARRQIGEAA